MYFEDLSNEVLLCIWEHLLDIEVIFSFFNINDRLDSLLYKYCGLHKKIDLRYSSLLLCQYFCQQIVTVSEWRDNLTTLKLGNRYRCSQLDILTSEITKSNIHLKPIFSNLTSIVIHQTTYISDHCRDILLYRVAGGSTLRRLVWNTCNRQAYTSKSFSDWLLNCSRNLNSFQYVIRGYYSCFELTYEDALNNNYISHDSLISLHISAVDLSTLTVLLHYLPQLQHLGK